MQFSIATIAAVAGLAAAAPHNHQQFHKKDLGSDLFGDLTSLLGGLGIKLPTNSKTANGNTWIGTDGPIVHTVQNKASSAVTFVLWGVQGSWVNAVVPQIAHTLQPGENLTLSHAIGTAAAPNTGGFAALYPDTQMLNGQISNIWGEFSFVHDQWASSTYDVSMEPNMEGHNLTIQGPKCTADANRCVFKCTNGQKVCGEEGTYDIFGCAAGSQPGASQGLWGNAAAGGCQGIDTTGITNLLTTLH